MYKLYGNDKNFEIDKKVRLTGLYGVNGTQNTTKCLGSPENRRIGTVKKQISQGYRRHKSWEIECNDGDTNEYNSNNLSAVAPRQPRPQPQLLPQPQPLLLPQPQPLLLPQIRYTRLLLVS